MAVDNENTLNVLETFTSYPKDILKLVTEYSTDEYLWVTNQKGYDNVQYPGPYMEMYSQRISLYDLYGIYDYCPSNIPTTHRLAKFKILIDCDYDFVYKTQTEKWRSLCDVSWIFKTTYKNDIIYFTQQLFTKFANLRCISYDIDLIKKLCDGIYLTADYHKGIEQI